ncbi:MAG: hypothetical protein HUJ76_08440 [Parasporobacterium sp.]|nr:hypothetical protein [Parasporobacterium sp.]
MDIVFNKREGKWELRIYTTNPALPPMMEQAIREAIESQVKVFNQYA